MHGLTDVHRKLQQFMRWFKTFILQTQTHNTTWKLLKEWKLFQKSFSLNRCFMVWCLLPSDLLQYLQTCTGLHMSSSLHSSAAYKNTWKGLHNFKYKNKTAKKMIWVVCQSDLINNNHWRALFLFDIFWEKFEKSLAPLLWVNTPPQGKWRRGVILLYAPLQKGRTQMEYQFVNAPRFAQYII